MPGRWAVLFVKSFAFGNCAGVVGAKHIARENTVRWSYATAKQTKDPTSGIRTNFIEFIIMMIMISRNCLSIKLHWKPHVTHTSSKVESSRFKTVLLPCCMRADGVHCRPILWALRSFHPHSTPSMIEARPTHNVNVDAPIDRMIKSETWFCCCHLCCVVMEQYIRLSLSLSWSIFGLSIFFTHAPTHPTIEANVRAKRNANADAPADRTIHQDCGGAVVVGSCLLL